MSDARAEDQRTFIRRTLTVAVVIIAVAAVLWLAYRLGTVIFMVFVSVFVTVAFEPPVHWLSKRGWRRGTATGVVFLVAWTVTYDPATRSGNLLLSLALSVGLAAVFTLVRLVQRQSASAAIGGLVAAAAAAGLSLLTGRGEDSFIPGFITNALYGSAFLISALIGWSLIGLAAGFLMGEGTAWRADKRKRRVYFWLAIAWASLFAARLLVQLPLYFADNVTALGTLKLVMGLPLFAPLVAVTWLAVRALYPRGESNEVATAE